MRILQIAALAVSLCWAGGASLGAASEDSAHFDRVIAPILARRCLDCHSGATPKGGLDLSRQATAMRGGDSGEAIVPSDLDASLLWENVGQGKMPPKVKLPDNEKRILRDWIAAGAKWGSDPIDPFRFTTDRRAGRDWWALQPVSRPALPPIVGREGALNPVDWFIRSELESKGLSRAPEADRRTLIRRLAFDLVGLPPTPEEVASFLQDGRAGAYERLVDRYLASAQYGVRWARRWLDLARFGESNGFEHDEFRPNARPYRDWVVDALNPDLPYDQFARLQLAGDVLFPDDSRAIAATGFLVAGAYDSVGQSQQSDAMRKVVRQDELEDLVGTVAQTFLGLTVHCARCHDHKFDPIMQSEYYAMTAALAGVRHGERDLTPFDPEVKATNARIDRWVAELAALEAPIRQKLGSKPGAASGVAPTPIARWDFDQSAQDQVGPLHGSLAGGAELSSEGLKLDGKTAYASTVPLVRDLKAKTIEAWVRLDDLNQTGGGVVSIQNLNGQMFDAIVFGERETGRWMAGSEGFVRFRPFEGPQESDAAKRTVHIVISYAEDGTISAYREGQPYGKPYNAGAPITFRAGQSQILFGLRHATPGGNRLLSGVVVRARLYDWALSAAEIAASAIAVNDAVPDSVIDASLEPEKKAERARLIEQISASRKVLRASTHKAYAVVPREPDTTHRLIRGNTAQPGEVVAPGGLSALAGLGSSFGIAADAGDAERRIRLAAWVSDARNPLFARVIVNRLWQGHFGAGLVETPSDFGFNGGRPSHPALLDWLACELIDRRWSLKQLHRLIVTSATYRQAAPMNPAAVKIDANNRLLWRKAPQRLEAESVRDAMLAVSGALDLRLGGPGFREFVVSQAPGTITNQYKPLLDAGRDQDRRTFYRTWARGGRSGFLDAFDCPDPSTTAPRRPVTTTPLQALAMLNNALVLRLSDRFADRLEHDAGRDVGRQIERAYQLALSRAPTTAELELCRAVVMRHGLAVMARAIFNCNEFLYVD